MCYDEVKTNPAGSNEPAGHMYLSRKRFSSGLYLGKDHMKNLTVFAHSDKTKAWDQHFLLANGADRNPT